MDASWKWTSCIRFARGLPSFRAYTATSCTLRPTTCSWARTPRRPTPFRHEQNMLICEGGKRVLIAGCAHRGIVNIMQRLKELDPTPPAAVFGGFHLAIPGTAEVDAELVDGTAARLMQSPGTAYYTGHCTGLPSFGRLKEVMGGRVRLPARGRERRALGRKRTAPGVIPGAVLHGSAVKAEKKRPQQRPLLILGYAP